MLGSEYTSLSLPEVNAAFVEKTASPEGIAEINVEGTQYIRNTLKEYSIWRQVIPPVYKRPSELVPSIDQDTLYDIVWLEPEAGGRVVTFQGDGDNKAIFGMRAAIHFGEIASPLWDKSITELAAYRIPITKIIEENTIKYLHAVADVKLTLAALDCASANLNYVGQDNLASSADARITSKGDISLLTKKINGADRMAKFIMFNQAVKDDLFAIPYTTVGDKETWLNGFKYTEIAGLTVVTSVKSKVFKPSLIFVTTAPEYLGVYEILEEPNFFVKRENHRIQMQAREVEAFAFVNQKSVAVMDTSHTDSAIAAFETTNVWLQSCTPTAATGTYAGDVHLWNV